jgi:hypothetical protein
VIQNPVGRAITEIRGALLYGCRPPWDVVSPQISPSLVTVSAQGTLTLRFHTTAHNFEHTKYFESLRNEAKFKHLGKAVKYQNYIHEEIKST